MQSKTLILSFLFFTPFGLVAQATSSYELIQKVFASVKAKDESAFLSLCPDSLQLVHIRKKQALGVIAEIKSGLPKNFSRRSMESLDRSLEPVRASLRRTYSPQEIQRIRQEFRDQFRSILTKVEEKRLDWETMTLTDYAFDSTVSGETLYSQSLPPQTGLQTRRGRINFKDRDSVGQIWFRDLLHDTEKNRWYAGALDFLVTSGDVVKIVDVQMQSIQELIPPPPPPPPPAPPRKKQQISPAKKKRPPKV